jgi:tetratricopeptide (TPR) repeat protein
MHSTKLSAFCDKVLEMGWTLAVVITPLFFNVYSSRVFEPDKLTTLRTLALIMAAAWFVKLIEERTNGQREIGFTWRTPLVFPTMFMVAVYLISTILSVTPYVSLFGSYQRLQGTYTTLAYIVVFLMILQGLRTRPQLERLLTVIILNSLPIALYGLIQRNKLDPLPWGGDVTRRVASNMGNAIFVAAYLIMAVPPTLARIVDAFRSILTEEETGAADMLRAASYIFIFLVQLIAIWYTQSRGPLMGLLAGLGVWGFLGLLALQQRARQEQSFRPGDLPRDLGRGLAFGLGSLAVAGAIAAILYFASQALFQSESSLPQTIAAGGAVLILVGAWLAFVVNQRGWRWLWISALALVILAAVGFLLINPGGPFHEWARQSPLSRVARVLESESGTGMVRNLIWQGGLDMLLPHKPIQYPPTEDNPHGHPDPFNALRTLVGYGPESMYVAYNSFYPPLLGHYESRTASPDRSHNETLDSLIITGVLGFVAYLWLFGSLFTFGLQWLGFLPSDWRRTLFFVLLIVGAIAATAIVIPTVGPHFLGLSIPAGMVGGMFIYLVVYAFSVYWESGATPALHPRFVVLTGILSAIVAHFIEINFGISIASTRTVFWTYAGLLVLVGMGLVREREREHRGRQKKEDRKKHRKHPERTLPVWIKPTLVTSLIGGFILGTLAFDFVTNSERLTQPLSIIWRALTILPAQDSRTSYGALMIFAFTWLMSAIVFIAQIASEGALHQRKDDWALASILYLLISLTVGLGYALVLAGRQVALIRMQPQTMAGVIGAADHVASVLTSYYGLIVCVLIAGGATLLLGTQQPRPVGQLGMIALVVLMVLAGAAAVMTNLRPIQADIIYKQANPYERKDQWLVAIEHYKHAIELAPREDFYYLYLGRAYLEYASTLDDPQTRDAVLRETERTLIQAREINPLNTDHSANLARMYRRWADFATDAELRLELLQRSSDNYDVATTLSPQNAILWNEWALLHLTTGNFEAAQEKISHSLGFDPGFDKTWTIQADLYANQGLITDALESYYQALEINPREVDVWLRVGDVQRGENRLEGAAEAYEQALELSPKRTQVWRVYGSVLAQLSRPNEAIDALLQALEIAPEASDAWDTHRILAILYNQIGQIDTAIEHAQKSLELAPEDQQPNIQQLVAQLQAAGSGGSEP